MVAGSEGSVDLEAGAAERTAREKGIGHAERYVYYYSKITNGAMRLLGMAIKRKAYGVVALTLYFKTVTKVATCT